MITMTWNIGIRNIYIQYYRDETYNTSHEYMGLPKPIDCDLDFCLLYTALILLLYTMTLICKESIDYNSNHHALESYHC